MVCPFFSVTVTHLFIMTILDTALCSTPESNSVMGLRPVNSRLGYRSWRISSLLLDIKMERLLYRSLSAFDMDGCSEALNRGMYQMVCSQWSNACRLFLRRV